jgi:hypothetical protein
MFIRPLDIAALPTATWQNHAGNTHFSLQSKKKDPLKAFFTGLGQSLTISTDPQQDAYIRPIADYDFRILLKIATRNKHFIIAVDDNFDKIHTGTCV